MIRHFFKLTWNKKRRHILLIIQLFFAYLVTSFLMFFFLSTSFFHKEEANINIENLIVIEAFNNHNDTVRQNLEAISEVKKVSLSDITPYRRILMRGVDTLQYGNTKIRVLSPSHADENLYSVLGLSMKSGRWFTANDKTAMKSPVIIDETLKDLLFPEIKAEGRIVKLGILEHVVIGVVKNLNDEYRYQDLFLLDTGAIFLARLNKPIDNNIHKKLKKALAGFQNEFVENIIPVKDYKEEATSQITSIVIVIGGLSGFLIINVILGLFSILYQNINRRRHEIGLRRAAGAVPGQIYKQIVLEVILLATIAIIPGIIVASQFAIFNVFGVADISYYPSILAGAVIIYILVILCALYPARLASKIQPAEALHEE